MRTAKSTALFSLVSSTIEFLTYMAEEMIEMGREATIAALETLDSQKASKNIGET